MRKKIVTSAVVLALASISGFLVSTTVFAAGGSSIVGTDPTGGSCGGNGISSTWWDSCFGYSWQVYDVLQDLPEGGIHFHTTGNTGRVVNITGCKAGQKLYNYGFETYKPDYNLTAGSLTALRGDYSIKYFESGYQVSTQKNKNGAQAPHANTGAKGVFRNGSSGTQPSANIDSYIKVVGYADTGSGLGGCGGPDNGTAYWKFCKMKEYIRNNSNEAQNFAGADVDWENVGAFCWDPGTMGDQDDPKEFYANSKVEANKVGSSSVRMVETGIVGQDSNVDRTLSISAGESVDIVFTHNLYSKYEVSDSEPWKAKRTFSAGVTMGGDTMQTVRGATRFNHPGREGLYAADNNPVLKDTYSSVRFNNPGQYSFCESITIGSVTTKACVEIRVTTFYASSKVEANKVGSSNIERAETGIVQNRDVSATLSIKVGESADIVFTHNLYSKEKVTSSKSWRAERDFSAGITMGGNTSKTVTGSTKFTGLTTESGMRLYAADRNPVLKDTYSNVKFSNPGNYSFCESVKIDVATTKACVNINVTEDGTSGSNPDPGGGGSGTSGPNPDPGGGGDDPCGFGLPGSYRSSNSMSGTTSVVSRVRNGNITGFQTVVYAKPGDTVTWCNAYYPGVQKAANATVTINNYDPEPTDLSGFTNSLTNGVFSDYSDWTNQYSISSINVRPYFSESRIFGKGNSNPQSSSNSVSVETDQVGQTLSETITSGYPSSVSVSSGSGPHSWSCHWKEEDERCGIVEYVKCNPHKETRCVAPNPNGGCFHYSRVTEYDECPVYGSCYVDTCRHTNLFYSNSRSSTASDTSYVQVPYNFKNTATVNISDSLVYAGETMSISSATVTVNKKWNDVTRGDYATRVDNAQTKLVGYLSSSSTGTEKTNHSSSNICSGLPVKNNSCNELNSYSNRTFNSSAKTEGSTDDLWFANQTYNVYDAKAGDYYCVVVAVYPSTSGSDTNLNASGDEKWYVSAPSCRVIAKKPSFQVWGGSVYSARAVKTSNASKNNLWNVPGYDYATTDTRNTVIFGSWVEQSVISNGTVTGLASGAATGDVADVRQTGSKEGEADPWGYCAYRVPLSIANNSTLTCPNVQAVGNAGLSNAAIDENSLMDYWNVSNVSYIDKTTINLASDYIETTTMQGNRVNYTEVAGNIYQASLTGATIRKGITHVVRTSGNLRIDGNIMYENATYSSQKEIPKLLIYASGNIVIDCGVSRIDAIIIAGGQVKTCDSSDNNARANSNQLKVNGMIIADKLILNRSYGAWVGTGSGVPAEIINYDTSAIVWGKGMAAKSDFDTLTIVYQHEIAPRY